MNTIFNKSILIQNRLKKYTFKRYLFEKIKNSKSRMIGIMGSRGVGKTILMVQLLNDYKLPVNQAVYISLDDPYFLTKKFSDFASEFYKLGGKIIFADEVHKYPMWSIELKHIYDFYDIKIIFSSSSILELYKAQADLSRRVTVFYLYELSLREFAFLRYNIDLPILNFDEIITNHLQISADLIRRIKPIKVLKEYYNTGALPFFFDDSEMYLERLKNTVNQIIEIDLPAVEKITFSTIYKMKKLLKIIAESVPFKPNIEKISRLVGTSRDRLTKFLQILERAMLIKNIRTQKHGISYLRKPDKILLHNTNLIYAFADQQINIGTIRETFFVNQTSSIFDVFYAEKADFIIKNYIFEIGGKTKNTNQIAGQKNAFVVADNIEIGSNVIIPLWLFGLLY
jgi:predicted AAA+ superfamily ATPase